MSAETASGPPGLSPRAYGWIVAVIVVLGLLQRVDCLGMGFVSDDYAQLSMLDGVYPLERASWDLFRFSDGTREESHALMQFGFYPWWSAPDLRLAMLRPLASLVIAFDHACFGREAVWFHAHSLLWWVLAMVTVAVLLGRILPRAAAAAAVAFYSVEEAHGLAVSWLANRSALMTVVFGGLAVLAHVEWRREGRRRWRAATWLGALAALACGEWAFSILAYVLAYELVAAPGPWTTRARALLPAVVPGVGYVLLRQALGFGVGASDVYIDPVAQPGAYLVAASQRVPVFFADLVTGIPADWWNLGSPWRGMILRWGLFDADTWRRFPAWQPFHVALGLGALLVAGVLARWVDRRAGGVRPDLRFLGAGSVLAMVPVVGSFPSGRLLLAPAVGAAAWFGVGLVIAVQALRDPSVARGARAGAAAWIAFLLWFHAWNAAQRTRWEIAGNAFHFDSARDWVLEAPVPTRDIAARRVVILGAIDHTTSCYVCLVRHYHGYEMPRSCWMLSGAHHAHDVERTGSNTLELTVLGGELHRGSMETLFRTVREPLELGTVVELDGLRVEVLRLVHGRPQKLRYVFDRPLDDPSLVFLHSTEHGLAAFHIPPVGATVRVPRAAIPDGTKLRPRTRRVPRARSEPARTGPRSAAYDDP